MRFESFIVCSDCSAEYLKSHLSSLVCEGRESYQVVSVVKGMYVGSYGYSASGPAMVGRGNSNGCVQQFPAFQVISLVKVCV
jgi:hypothetical protein